MQKKGVLPKFCFLLTLGGPRLGLQEPLQKSLPMVIGKQRGKLNLKAKGLKLGGRKTAKNKGINKSQKMFSKMLKDFRISAACAPFSQALKQKLCVCVNFCPARSVLEAPNTYQKKREFSSLYPPASAISLPTHIKFI